MGDELPFPGPENGSRSFEDEVFTKRRRRRFVQECREQVDAVLSSIGRKRITDDGSEGRQNVGEADQLLARRAGQNAIRPARDEWDPVFASDPVATGFTPVDVQTPATRFSQSGGAHASA